MPRTRAVLLWALALAAPLSSAFSETYSPAIRNIGLAPGDEAGIRHAVFTQPIDHARPALGSFAQAYAYNAEFYRGEGSPVVLVARKGRREEADSLPITAGAEPLAGTEAFLTTATLSGALARELGAAVVLLEHRYFGDSSPFADLTAANLTYLTVDNAMSDMVRFARHVRLPFDPRGTSSAVAAPWVLTGGSYAGALAAWTASTHPGTFWAYHASSAPVQALSNFSAYYEPVARGIPRNCSDDVAAVVSRADAVLTAGREADKTQLKHDFGLPGLADDDFAAALAVPLYAFERRQLYTDGGIQQFCDYLESAAGSGVQRAMQGYAGWIQLVLASSWYCTATYGAAFEGGSLACLDTHNASNPIFRDTALGNGINRQWWWLLCNEPLEYWRNGGAGAAGLVSRLVGRRYWERQCAQLFPGASYGIADGATVARINARTGGWNPPLGREPRVLFVDGEADAWRGAGVSSGLRPGGPLEANQVLVVPGGYHCSDLITENGRRTAAVQAVQDRIVARIAAWVREFPGKTQV